MPAHDEQTFGDAIVASMTARGWTESKGAGYLPEFALEQHELFTFIGATQIEQWNRLVEHAYGGDAGAAQLGFLRRVHNAINTDGVLKVLRDGVKDHGCLFRLAEFKPNLITEDADLDPYRANRLTVFRELKYAFKQANKDYRLDLTLFINGIPVATAELKNPLTGQNVEHAKQQYREERDPTELIFTHRSVANFAVDPHLVFVTTKLRGRKTFFLPFNTGSNGPGSSGGAGNPAPTRPGAHATAYLWEEVWAPDNWLELLHRYVIELKDKSSRTTIFPRFHQWDAVRKLAAHARFHGPGEDYLVMASAGSGKSNTISWLAHRLSDLHTSADPAEIDPEALARGVEPGRPVFDKTIVITDRRNLDAQLRKNVAAFERTNGLVVAVDDKGGSKSEALARALASSQGKIVTVTLQSFPALLDYLKRNPTEIHGKRFAIVIDEAHSSQSGQAADAVKDALRDLGLDADDDGTGAESAPVDLDDRLRRKAERRQKAPNLSYFAFTATPKAKTLEDFGTLDAAEEHYVPFHAYSMRQAIEEGFILDPLANYVTYDTFFKLVNQNPDNREVDPTKANAMLARIAFMHEATAYQQSMVIVEQFVAHTRGRLGGRAKAMVVTSSRYSAVQTAREIKKYLAARSDDPRYQGIGVLTAFSGSLDFDGEEVTESKENGGLPESQLPEKFAYTRADDKAVKAGAKGKQEFRILVVADKYQTGFDQPLLTTMYVLKRLNGIAAVQTLSRLNRTAARKSQSDLAVLDFVNKTEEIQESFRPFFEQAEALPSDPNLLYVAQSQVMAPGLLFEDEIRSFAAAWLDAEDRAAGSQVKRAELHAELYRRLGPAVDRFTELLAGDDESIELAENFRADLKGYVRKYGFLSSIITYADADLEALYIYGRFLLKLLPQGTGDGVDVGDVDLSHLRIERSGEHDLRLAPGGAVVLPGFGDGTGRPRDEEERTPLQDVVEKFNAKWGTSFTEEDFRPAWEASLADPGLQMAAAANDDVENFQEKFEEVFERNMINHFETAQDLSDRYFDSSDPRFRQEFHREGARAAWRILRRTNGVPTRD
ncbi:type I restriction endonuclease subunit R [Glycomyces sp. NRRL B-16210]|uniref:type I restriction endonuclease subunit R n=1 Tax=Glycomyces sp. NRRL B-16210 TaxID=1463821 RepID=UPI0004C075FB|nr:type I restriction endonuclease [Glycomyces sp. NRRL B-16210]